MRRNLSDARHDDLSRDTPSMCKSMSDTRSYPVTEFHLIPVDRHTTNVVFIYCRQTVSPFHPNRFDLPIVNFRFYSSRTCRPKWAPCGERCCAPKRRTAHIRWRPRPKRAWCRYSKSPTGRTHWRTPNRTSTTTKRKILLDTGFILTETTGRPSWATTVDENRFGHAYVFLLRLCTRMCA